MKRYVAFSDDLSGGKFGGVVVERQVGEFQDAQQVGLVGPCAFNRQVQSAILGVWGEDLVKLKAQLVFKADLFLGFLFFEIKEFSVKIPVKSFEIVKFLPVQGDFGKSLL